MKIKLKFLLSIMSLILAFGILLNISIRYIMNYRMETSITTSLNQIMYSTREAIKYRLLSNDLPNNYESIAKESEYLNRYISSNFSCSVEIRNTDGLVISDNVHEDFREVLDKGSMRAEAGAAVVNLTSKNNSIYGILSYPIIINEETLGILNLVKDFNDLYIENKKVLFIISLIELLLLIIIFIISYIIISKVTSPIIALTQGFKRVGEGDYSFSMRVKGKDEVAILTNEFINMKDKIQEQITTIKEEKLKVEKLEKGRKSFFDNVTHEMKTPLTAISGYAEMIKDDMVIDEQFKKRAIERIYMESQRLHSLIIDLIEISRGLSYTQETTVEIPIKPLLDEVCEDMKIKGKKYSININREINIGTIRADENRIRQLIINIIDNGIKYSRKNNTLTILGKTENNNYLIKVTSISGPIPKEIYDHIFNPFIKSNIYKESESRGLGLYLCKQIVQDYNGTINILNGNEIVVEIRFPIN